MPRKPTADEVRDVLNYNPHTGVFTWATSNRVRKAGQVAGGICDRGYVTINIFGQPRYAHRLAYLYMTGEWPSSQVDHKDRNRTNNRWDNLRLASVVENVGNSKVRNDNTTGFKGVHRYSGKFRAKINIDGRQVHLGTFDTPEDASKAYIAAAKRRYGEYFPGLTGMAA